MNHLNQDIFGREYFFGEYKFREGGISTYENVSICNDYHVSDIFRIEVKYSRWGKNSQGGVNIYQVGQTHDIYNSILVY